MIIVIHLPEIKTGETKLVDTGTLSLRIVIEQYQQLLVDDYQRTYAWSKDEITELFEDLCECARSRENHFFGTLILQRTADNKAKVVDGQQRLTSIFLLVATLRDELAKLPSHTISIPGMIPVDVMQKVYQFLYPTAAFALHRFVPNRFLQQLNNDVVMAMPGSQQEVPGKGTTLTLAYRKGIRAVRKLVADDIAKYLSDAEKLARVDSLINAILQNFQVLCVPTSSLSESLDIFLTMNNRGMPLGPSDLVRGAVMGQLSEGAPEAVQQQIFENIFKQWNDIAENVKDPESFLRHYLVANQDEKIQKKKVLKTITDLISGPDAIERKQKAQEFWDTLRVDSETYAAILNPPVAEEWGYFTYLLNGLLKSHRIFLLKLVPSAFPAEQKAELVRLVFVLSYKWVIDGKNAQQLEDYFQERTKDLRNGQDFTTIAEDLAKKAAFESDIDDYLKLEGDSSYIGKSLLHLVDRVTNPLGNFSYLDSTLHLEHIIPQTSIDHWNVSLELDSNLKSEEYDALISQIGNLTLLDAKLNIDAKQSPFAVKALNHYKNAKLSIATDLYHVSDWTLSEVELRNKWVIETVKKVLSVVKHPGTPEQFSVWLSNHTD
jgi:hypothetical protein